MLLRTTSKFYSKIKRDLWRNRRKVFCIGWQKTGTTSLGRALSLLHYRVDTWNDERFNWIHDLRNNDTSKIIKEVQSFDAAEDNPYPLIYEDLVSSFPEAKFILTIRDSDSWYESALNHWRSHPSPMLEFIYGNEFSCPEGNREHWISRYEQHNRSVIEFFATDEFLQKRLLILNFREGDGWRELCLFLDVKVPSVDFPHLNQQRIRDFSSDKYRNKI